MPPQSIHQPFTVHIEDAHPKVKVGRRHRGRSMLMTTMEFRTAASSGIQVRAENAEGLRISVTGPKPGDDLLDPDSLEVKPDFEATAVCRPVYNTRTAITVTHRDVNLALLKRTNPVRFVTVAPIPENELSLPPPVREDEVEVEATRTRYVESSVDEVEIGEEQDESLEDIPPRPSCPEPSLDEDEDEVENKLLPRKRPNPLVLTDIFTNLPSGHSPLCSANSVGTCYSEDSFDDITPSECSFTLSQTGSVSSMKSGRFTNLKKTVKLRIVSGSSGRASSSMTSLHRSPSHDVAASSTISLTASVKSPKGKRSMKTFLSTITKGKRKPEVWDTLVEDEIKESKAAVRALGSAAKGTKRAREEENLPTTTVELDSNSKGDREVKGRRIKRKLAAF